MSHGAGPVDNRPMRVVFTRELDQGPLIIGIVTGAGFSKGLELDDGLGKFAHYSSIIQKFEVFERILQDPEGKLCLALINDHIVIGYLAGWRPSENDRWYAMGDVMFEMGAIEVSRNYRGLGIADLLFEAMMADEFFEEKIAYMNGFSWHWDLEGSGLTMPEYRRMMVNFVKRKGFKELYTNEPNVAMRDENFFTARIGSKVSEEDIKKFKNLRFGIKP